MNKDYCGFRFFSNYTRKYNINSNKANSLTKIVFHSFIGIPRSPTARNEKRRNSTWRTSVTFSISFLLIISLFFVRSENSGKCEEVSACFVWGFQFKRNLSIRETSQWISRAVSYLQVCSLFPYTTRFFRYLLAPRTSTFWILGAMPPLLSNWIQPELTHPASVFLVFLFEDPTKEIEGFFH